MTTFDNIDRNDQGPADHLVGEYNYLNASGRIEAQRVRDLIDQWLQDYPDDQRQSLTGRLRSRNDRLHRSSYFELFLHALLVHCGFTVVEIEPELENGRRPDFLVEAPDGSRFFLEATLASGLNDADAGADRRLREAIQAIDDVKCPNFFLHLSTRGTPDQPIGLRNLRRSVQAFVDGLDYQEAIQATEAGNYERPVWLYQEHGVHFRISAFPKHTPKAGHRAIGGRMLPGGLINPEAAIKSSVEAKAGRYGELDIPLIIAVNALEEYARVNDAIDALFGTKAAIFPQDGEPRLCRNPDGAWCGPNGPVYTRSSAVLFVDRLSPWSLAQRTATLIHNPWAQNPLPEIPLGIGTYRVVDDQLSKEDGQPLRQIFGLPEGWPE